MDLEKKQNSTSDGQRKRGARNFRIWSAGKVDGKNEREKITKPCRPHREQERKKESGTPTFLLCHDPKSEAEQRGQHPHQRARLKVHHLPVVQFHRCSGKE